MWLFLFIFHFLRSRGLSFSNIINIFSSSFRNNEKHVISFVKQKKLNKKYLYLKRNARHNSAIISAVLKYGCFLI